MGNTKKKSNSKKDYDYIIYTDGGCAINPGGPGGCAAVVTNMKTGEKTELSKGYQSTTNNRMEMMAVIIAMESIPDGSHLKLYSDSQYVIKTLQGIFRKKKNLDLWKRMDRALKNKKIDVCWVKGHSGIKENERCDELCTKAMALVEKEIDHGYKGRTVETDGNKLSGGAMSIQIVLPEPFSSEQFHACSIAEYVTHYQVHDTCAKSIIEFYTKCQNSFKSYASIKSDGIDFWSRKTKTSIEKILKEQGMDDETLKILWTFVEKYIPELVDQIYCIRWYMRGMLLKDCIRKTLVEIEVRENFIKS